jgi:hypothetical protein
LRRYHGDRQFLPDTEHPLADEYAGHGPRTTREQTAEYNEGRLVHRRAPCLQTRSYTGA